MHLRVGRLAVGGNREGGGVLGDAVDVLHEDAAVNRAELERGRRVDAAGGEHAQVLLLLQKLERVGRERGRDEHFHEEMVLVDVIDHVLRDLAVCRDDSTVGALRVACEGLVEGSNHALGSGRSARVLVLQDDHGGLVELAHERPAGVGVEDVVVGKLLAVELLGVHEAVLALEVGQTVEGGFLMRILAVAQPLLLDHIQVVVVGELAFALGLEGVVLLGELFEHPVGDGPVVGARGLEDVQGQAGAGRALRGAVVFAHLGQDVVVAFGVGDHSHALEVLRGAAQHRRAADVDVLDAGSEIGAGFHRLLEGIQVHDDHVDHLDAVLGGFGHVLGVVALRQKPAVHHRVQRLHTAVHHLGEMRHLVDGGHGNARLGDDLRGTARRDDFRAELVVQRTREVDDARLVGHRHEDAFDLGISHACSPLKGWNFFKGARPCARRAPRASQETSRYRPSD